MKSRVARVFATVCDCRVYVSMCAYCMKSVSQRGKLNRKYFGITKEKVNSESEYPPYSSLLQYG